MHTLALPHLPTKAIKERKESRSHKATPCTPTCTYSHTPDKDNKGETRDERKDTSTNTRRPARTIKERQEPYSHKATHDTLTYTCALTHSHTHTRLPECPPKLGPWIHLAHAHTHTRLPDCPPKLGPWIHLAHAHTHRHTRAAPHPT